MPSRSCRACVRVTATNFDLAYIAHPIRDAADEARLTVYHTAAIPAIDCQVVGDNNDRAAAFQGLSNGG